MLPSQVVPRAPDCELKSSFTTDRIASERQLERGPEWPRGLAVLTDFGGTQPPGDQVSGCVPQGRAVSLLLKS